MNKEKLKKAALMILEAIGEDPKRKDLLGTPGRVAEMYEEILSGQSLDPKKELEILLDHKHEEIVPDAIAVLFYARVSLSVMNLPGPGSAGWRCSRSPEQPRFFVPEINVFRGSAGDRIVLPRRQAIHLAVAVPGDPLPCFIHEGAEIRVRENINPRCGSSGAAIQPDHIFPAFLRESSDAIVKSKLGRRHRPDGVIWLSR